VASGLAERVEVSQYRLATHLTLACLIYAAVVWTALRLSPNTGAAAPLRIRASVVALLVLVLLQIYLGALVAGLRAGLIYNTWPLIDGALIPKASALFFYAPWWRNLFESTLTVQFDHRLIGYLLFIAAILHVADVARTVRDGLVLTGALMLASAVTIQAVIGILTVIHQTPLALALLHQGVAMVVLTIAVGHAERVTERGVASGELVAALPSTPKA
jgi:cytochrome c oxidase assembly protein subunit 15